MRVISRPERIRLRCLAVQPEMAALRTIPIKILTVISTEMPIDKTM